MLRRRTPEPAPAPAEPAPAPKPGGKGRPTPKRSEAEQKRRRPLGPPPTSRKEAYRQARAQTKERRAELRQGALRGDDKFLPRRDAGPVRRLVRDAVDSRRNVAGILLPLTLIVFLGQLAGDKSVAGALFLVWFASTVVMIGDSVLLGRRIAGLVRERFPDTDERMRSLVLYGISRSTTPRRIRMPKAAVTPGERI